MPKNNEIVFVARAAVSKDPRNELTRSIIKGLAELCVSHGYTLIPSSDLKQSPGALYVAIGGDGTMMEAMRQCEEFQGCGVIGINTGSLGAICDLNHDNVTALHTLIHAIMEGNDGVFKRDNRHYLIVNTATAHGKAFNEVYLGSCQNPSLIEFSITVDNELVYKKKSAGLVIATPTGASAHSMSLGGPLIHPSSDCFVITPDAAHSLASRPLIIPRQASIEVTFELPYKVDKLSILNDGMLLGRISRKTTNVIRIRGSESPVTIFRRFAWSYYHSMNRHFGW